MVKLKLECSVNIDTLRGQLLYEIQGLYYYNPDVIADITCIDMEQIGKDKVLVSGVKGTASCDFGIILGIINYWY